MKGFKFLNKDKISKLPKTSGVYAFLEGAKLFYIGKAINIRERIKQHFKQPTRLFNQPRRLIIGYIETCSEIEALLLEARLIKRYQPKYNVAWKDDKNYFFVGITRENYPRVFITHQPNRVSGILYLVSGIKKNERKNTKYKIQNTRYFGPFVDGAALKQALKILRKVLPYYTAKKHPPTLCPWCHLNLCPGPNPVKSEYQKNIKNLISILEGKSKTVLKILKREMKSASISQDFEKAAKTRDRISALERIMAYAKIFKWLEENLITRSWQNYDVGVWFKRKISRIEAYDVSDIQGQQSTGSMVTFIEGKPDKNFYRRFKIKIAKKPNDVAMIKEVLSRRFNHLEWPYPNLILIDGGKAQLNTALDVLNRHKSAESALISVLALAKKENKLYIEGRKEPLLLKNLPREIFNLILQLRDEAHRFAISYHHKLRTKALLGD